MDYRFSRYPLKDKKKKKSLILFLQLVLKVCKGIIVYFVFVGAESPAT